MKTKRIDRPFEVRSVTESGSFAGYGSVFGTVDSYRDVVEKGAFARSLAAWEQRGQLPALLWQHKSDEPIGVYTRMVEDDHGLFVEGQLALKTQRGAEAHELLKLGALRGLSIGFNYADGGVEYEKTTDTFRVKEVDLWETSLVTFPANTDATVIEVRSERELEKHLRDAGLSRAAAKALLARGFAGLRDLREADTQVDELKQLMLSNPFLR